MDRKQAEKISESLMSEYRSSLADAGQKKHSRDEHSIIQHWVGSGALAGLAIGSVIGHFVAGEWCAGSFIGLGCGAVVGRLFFQARRKKKLQTMR